MYPLEVILNDWLHVKKKSQNLNKTLNAVNPILDPALELSAIRTDNNEVGFCRQEIFLSFL